MIKEQLQQTTGENPQLEAEGPQPAEEPIVLQNLPPELKDLEGKDLQTALAELKNLKKSYEEAQKLIGRQGQELGMLRQMVQQFAQQQNYPFSGNVPQGIVPPQPQQQYAGPAEEDLDDINKLIETVKATKKQLEQLAEEKQRLMAYVQAQDVKNSVLSKLPDAHEYEEEIRGLSQLVDPRYLTMPQAWHMIYLTAKNMRELTKYYQPATYPQNQYSAGPMVSPPQPPTGTQQQTVPTGEAGMQSAAKKTKLEPIPPDVEKTIKRVARRLNIQPEKLEEYLRG